LTYNSDQNWLNFAIAMITKLLDGRYQITETIETAEWGQTYLAKDTHLPGEPQCFIKHLQPAQFAPELIEVIRQKLQRETKVLEVLAPYEQVPKLLAYFEDNHEFFLVESYSPGHALETEIVASNPLEEQTVISLMKDVLEILAYLQSKGVVHGDIRPSNLIRREIDGKLQLIDFGAAQYFTFPSVTALNPNYGFDPAQVVNSLSTQDLINQPVIENNINSPAPTGSLNYLPPPFNSDVYSLGLMVIRALTGLSEEELEKLKVFNNGDQYPQITWRHLAICSVAFGDIVDKMVAVDEQVRYASAVAVQQDLQELENRTITDVYKYETYREEVRRVSSYRGEISVVGREILDELKNNLGLSDQEVENIEDEILNPYRKYREKGQRYEQALLAAVETEYPFSEETLEELQRLQQILGLTDEDVAVISEKTLPKSLYVKIREFWQQLWQPKRTSKKSIVLLPGISTNRASILVNQTAPTRKPFNFKSSLLSVVIFGVLLASLAAMISYYLSSLVKQKEEQLLLTKWSQLEPSLTVLYQNGDYRGCLNTISQFSQTLSRPYPMAEQWSQQCQKGLNWGNPRTQDLTRHLATVNAIALSPDGKILASASRDKTVKIVDANNGNPIQTFLGDDSAIWSVDFNPDASGFIMGTNYWRAIYWDLMSGSPIWFFDHNGPVWSSIITPDNKYAVTGSGDKTVGVWDLATGELATNLTHHNDTVYTVAVTPDSQKVVSGGLDQTIKISDLTNGNLLSSWVAHVGGVRAITISPDGNKIVSGGYDDTAKVWDLNTGKLLLDLTGHTGDVVSVAISSNGQTIATASKDKTIRLWDMNTGTLLNTLQGHTDEILTVKFSPDGQTIFSGGKDHTVRAWRK
jgi:WD40 repeat protein/serine/threonine protein kinase